LVIKIGNLLLLLATLAVVGKSTKKVYNILDYEYGAIADDESHIDIEW